MKYATFQDQIISLIDGSGRIARFLLDIAHTTMNYEYFIKLISELVIESEELWLSILE